MVTVIASPTIIGSAHIGLFQLDYFTYAERLVIGRDVDIKEHGITVYYYVMCRLSILPYFLYNLLPWDV